MNFPNRREYVKYIILKCALLVFLVNQILGISMSGFHDQIIVARCMFRYMKPKYSNKDN